MFKLEKVEELFMNANILDTPNYWTKNNMPQFLFKPYKFKSSFYHGLSLKIYVDQ
jgi:hypothetical protein